MTTPRNDEIQASIVAYLKGIYAIYSQLVIPDFPTGTPTEIREDQWQGTEFDYPNIRVRMINNLPDTDDPSCCNTSFTVSIMAFSQEYSSQEADRIAGLIHTYLSGKSFESSGVYLYLRTTNIIPAVRSDVHTWRAECLMTGRACYQSAAPAPVPEVWYLSGGISGSVCIGAWQAKGAASRAASYNNLANPGTSTDITQWQSPAFPDLPTWDAAIGWTSYAETKEIGYTDILNPLPITYIWRGKLDNTLGGNNNIVMNPDGWNGLFGICIGGGNLMIGFNAWFDAAYTVAIADFNIQHTICYQKLTDNSQNLWVDGVLQAGSPKAGTLPTQFWMSIYTGNEACESVALYRFALTDAQVIAVSNAMAAL